MRSNREKYIITIDKINNLLSTQIYFGGTNNILADCIVLSSNQLFKAVKKKQISLIQQ